MKNRAGFLMLFYVLLVALMANTGCNSKTEVHALQELTEDTHDEAMADLAVMNRTGRALRQLLTQLDSLDHRTTGRRDSIILTLQQMEQADDHMMTWMAGYKNPEKLPKKEALQYLLDQKQKIELNRDEIRSALVAGQQLLQQ